MSAPPLTLNAWLRYDVVRRILKRTSGVATVIEFGAGRGAVGTRLAQTYRYTGVEPDETSFSVARSRMGAHGAMVHDTSEIPAGSLFDLACAFEVLEHIEDDDGALQSWRKLIRPGGYLVLSVPAHQARFAAADHVAGHFRRYDPDVMLAVLQRAGFVDPMVRLYGFPFGYVLEWARNAIARRSRKSGSIEARTAASGRWLQPPSWLGWATYSVALVFRGAQRVFGWVPRGTGLIAVARNPE